MHATTMTASNSSMRAQQSANKSRLDVQQLKRAPRGQHLSIFNFKFTAVLGL